jgi:ABC-2 type transport system ATP-binding protein
MGNNNEYVVLENVTKHYRDVVALDSVSFQIAQGGVFGYIGPNGAGKTTTIKILVGLLTAFQGRVFIAGKPMPRDKDQIHKMLGYLPQQVAFQDWRTVDHALRSFGKLSGMDAGELDRRIEDVLGLLDLTPSRFRRVSELSGGTIQRLGLAQALLHAPRLLVLDEPLAGLDPTSRTRVKTVIRRLSQQGTTILFSSHILSDVQDVADKIAILNQGHLVHIGTLDELTRKMQLTDEVEVVLSRDSGCWQKIAPLPGIRTIEARSPNQLRAYLQQDVDRDEAIHRLIVSLVEAGCYIRSLQPVTRSLDELYLRSLEGEKGV